MKVRLTIDDDSGRTYQGEVVLRLQGTFKRVAQKGPKKSHPSGGPKKPMQALRYLHEQEVFKTARTLGQVEAELAKLDCNFPKASLSKALKRANFLTRHGKRRNYRWIQRFKPGVETCDAK